MNKGFKPKSLNHKLIDFAFKRLGPDGRPEIVGLQMTLENNHREFEYKFLHDFVVENVSDYNSECSLRIALINRSAGSKKFNIKIIGKPKDVRGSLQESFSPKVFFRSLVVEGINVILEVWDFDPNQYI